MGNSEGMTPLWGSAQSGSVDQRNCISRRDLPTRGAGLGALPPPLFLPLPERLPAGFTLGGPMPQILFVPSLALLLAESSGERV
ncbi:MAG: hypothetical protein GY946_02885 [bacterium]|nr:hypothetical protein [bacterium]